MPLSHRLEDNLLRQGWGWGERQTERETETDRELGRAVGFSRAAAAHMSLQQLWQHV